MSPDVVEAVGDGFSSRHETLLTAVIGIQSHNSA